MVDYASLSISLIGFDLLLAAFIAIRAKPERYASWHRLGPNRGSHSWCLDKCYYARRSNSYEHNHGFFGRLPDPKPRPWHLHRRGQCPGICLISFKSCHSCFWTERAIQRWPTDPGSAARHTSRRRCPHGGYRSREKCERDRSQGQGPRCTVGRPRRTAE